MDLQGQKREEEFKDVVETLVTMFGEVLSREVLYAVVENCNGDVNMAADAAMTIAEGSEPTDVPGHNHVTNTKSKTEQHSVNQINKLPDSPAPIISENAQQNNPIQNQLLTNQAPETSYAFTAAVRNTGAVPKILPKPAHPKPQPWIPWNDTLQTIATNHNLGNRTLILMRGLPGSGKTFLAIQVIDMCFGADPINFKTYKRHIFSTDDFFIVRGVYTYNKSRLSEAHEWNQRRVDTALKQGLSPIIIDNTNVEVWEMRPYIQSGVNNGYIIEVLEPNTPWAKKANVLVKKNSHNVPIHTIKRMLDNFGPSFSGNDLISCLKISCETEKRKLPPVDQSKVLTEKKIVTDVEHALENNASQYQCGNQSLTIHPVQQIPSSEPSAKKDINTCTKRDLDNTKNVSKGENQIAKDETRYMKLSRDLGYILNRQGQRNTEAENIESYFLLLQHIHDLLCSQNVTHNYAELEKQETEHEVNLYNSMIGNLQGIMGAESEIFDEDVNTATYLRFVKRLNAVACMSISNNHPPVPVLISNNNDIMEGDKERFSEIEKQLVDIINSETPENSEGTPELTQNEDLNQRCKEMEKKLEDILKVEDEWERGEAWDEVQKEASVKNSSESNPKPPRSDSQRSPQKDLLDSVSQCQDWRQIAIFMPPWHDNDSNNKSIDIKIPVTATISKSTFIESGDTDLNKLKPGFRILTGKPNDINFYHVPVEEKIPQTRMFDKGTMTNDFDFEVSGAFRCKNEEQHFVSLRKMFRNLPRAELRDIFDNCCGDVNWAVEIILDGVASNQLVTVEDISDSDPEESTVELCSCLAAYNIVPSANVDGTDTAKKTIPEKKNDDMTINIQNTTAQKKQKSPPNETALKLKRQIEQNFVIPDNHYSQPLLSIRRKRYGEGDTKSDEEDNGSSKYDIAQALPLNEEPKITTGTEFGPIVGERETPKTQQIPIPLDCEVPSTSTLVDPNYGPDSDCDEDSSYSSGFEEKESMVNIKLYWEVIRQLDNTFGREDVSYPLHVEPNISIPVSLLNEINAYWIESVMNQMDNHDKLNAKLLKEDEDFAKEIQQKEQELYARGNEPRVPDFKEIMDLDVAISLYQKQVEEWRNKTPDDLAAKMTRDKLYNLFPECTQDVLTELLMAHDNNFKATVESLLMSTGRNELLEEKNGLNKFVLNKELERQQKVLEEQEKALSGVQWPPLPPGETVDMSSVHRHRDMAEQHLQKRTQNFNKARNYICRGMTTVASYFSDLAHFHTKQYEHHSSLAAASLMQVHASRCPNSATIDLHFHRVAEARETLDLFLDSHINKLKEFQAKNQGPRMQKLFFITGRGAHSQFGRAKVKPAVRRRLRERGLTVSECNPGLLTAQVTADDKLSYQVTPP